MNNNKNYIEVKHIDYNYEIYVVNGNNRIKLNRQNKIIMHKVLKKFPYKKSKNNSLIYSNSNLITLYFVKEKLKYKSKKVNREKSRAIISGIALTTVLAVAAIGIYRTAANALNNEPIVAVAPTPDENSPTIPFDDTDISINRFDYHFDKPNDKAALENSSAYMEVFNKYERIYGVDAKLLCAIGAQECSGIHHEHSITGGHSVGLMGIENIWDDANLKVFNFETNSYEIITVDYSRMGELDYNIKIGAAVFQNYFYATLRNADFIDKSEQLVYSLQKYNMGPGNMHKLSNMGGNWIDNRELINAGDSKYFEHVLSRLDNGTIIDIRLTDGSYHQTKLTNIALENKYTRT